MISSSMSWSGLFRRAAAAAARLRWGRAELWLSRPLRQASRGTRPRRRRTHQPGDRRVAVRRGEDRERSCLEHLAQVRRAQSRRSRCRCPARRHPRRLSLRSACRASEVVDIPRAKAAKRRSHDPFRGSALTEPRFHRAPGALPMTRRRISRGPASSQILPRLGVRASGWVWATAEERGMALPWRPGAASASTPTQASLGEGGTRARLFSLLPSASAAASHASWQRICSQPCPETQWRGSEISPRSSRPRLRVSAVGGNTAMSPKTRPQPVGGR
jgi:hypothetical protein